MIAKSSFGVNTNKPEKEQTYANDSFESFEDRLIWRIYDPNLIRLVESDCKEISLEGRTGFEE
jgi:hypothetical protein